MTNNMSKLQNSNKTNQKRLIGLILMCVSVVSAILCLFPGFLSLGFFLYRIFGYSMWMLIVAGLILGLSLFKNLNFVAGKKYLIYLFFSYFSVISLVHLIFSTNVLSSLYLDFNHMGKYIGSAYSLEHGVTIGGASLSIFIFLIRGMVGVVGSYVVYVIMSAIFIGLTIDYSIYTKAIERRKNLYSLKTKQELENKLNGSAKIISEDFGKMPNYSFTSTEEQTYDESSNSNNEENSGFSSGFSWGNSISNENNEQNYETNFNSSFAPEYNSFGIPDPSVEQETQNSQVSLGNLDEERERARQMLFEKYENKQTIDEQPQTEPMSAREKLFGSNPKLPDYLYTNPNAERDARDFVNNYNNNRQMPGTDRFAQYESPTPTRTPNLDNNILSNGSVRSSWETFNPELVSDENNETTFDRLQNTRMTNTNNLFGFPSASETENLMNSPAPTNSGDMSFTRSSIRSGMFSPVGQGLNALIPEEKPEPVQEKPKKVVSKQTNIYDDAPKKYFMPATSLMTYYKDDNTDHSVEYKRKSAILEQLLESFKIPATVTNVVRGPKVTRYELTKPIGIPVTRITSLDKDIEMALETPSGIRIEAPIPGKNAVGIEVQNDKSSTVGLREIIESPEFTNAKQLLPIAIGKNISGNVVVHSLKKMVHVLVAGSTGSGKSVFLHSLILSLLFKCGPDDLKFIIIDPKQVEFGRYNGLPHLILPKVITDFEAAINGLGWAVKEMDRRFKLLSELGYSNIEIFNESDKVKSGEEKKMPYLVIIIDELADLMTFDKNNIEKAIQRITQLGRAAGIHMVVATQRPSVDVITGVIKNNLPTRIAFSLASGVDSKTIINEVGAEKLLGQGDMLFAPQDSNKKTRLQAAYISDPEIDKIVKYIIANNIPSYDESIAEEINRKKEEVPENDKGANGAAESKADQMDELMPKCLELVMQRGKATTTMLQTKLSIGYSRAARIIGQMEEKGFISNNTDGKPREVFITQSQFDALFGNQN